MVILVDTSVLIDFLRLKNKEATLYFQTVKGEDPAVSFVSIAELYAGRSIVDKDKKEIVDELIASCEVVDGNLDIYKKAGEIMRLHRPTNFQDAMIAATAIYYKLPLLTLNIKHFKKIKSLSLYPHIRS